MKLKWNLSRIPTVSCVFPQRAPSVGAADTFRWFFWRTRHRSTSYNRTQTLEELQVIPLQSTLPLRTHCGPFSTGGVRCTCSTEETSRASLWVSDWPHLNQTPTDVERQGLEFSRIRTPSEPKGTVHLKSNIWSSFTHPHVILITCLLLRKTKEGYLKGMHWSEWALPNSKMTKQTVL